METHTPVARDLVFCTERSVERASPLYLTATALVQFQAKTLPALVEVYPLSGGQASPTGAEGRRAQGAIDRDAPRDEKSDMARIQMLLLVLLREVKQDDRPRWKSQQARLSDFFPLFNMALRLRSISRAAKLSEVFDAIATLRLLSEALQGLQLKQRGMNPEDRRKTSWSYRLDSATDRLAQALLTQRGSKQALEGCIKKDTTPPTEGMLWLAEFLRHLVVEPYKRAQMPISPWRQYYGVYPEESVLILSPESRRTGATSPDEIVGSALRARGLRDTEIASAAYFYVDMDASSSTEAVAPAPPPREACRGTLASPQCQTQVLKHGPYSKVIWFLTRRNAAGGALGAARLWQKAELDFLVRQLRVRADVICIPDGELTAEDKQRLDQGLEAFRIFRLIDQRQGVIAFTRASPLQTLALRTLDYLGWILRCHLQSQTGKALVECWRQTLQLYEESLLAIQAYLRDARDYLLSDETTRHRQTLFAALVATKDAGEERVKELRELEPPSERPGTRVSGLSWAARRRRRTGAGAGSRRR